MLIYIIIFFSIVPLIIWKVGDGKKDRHKMLAGLVFDKFDGFARFDNACSVVFKENVNEFSKESFDSVALDWKKSFRNEVGLYLQAKYSSPELSKLLGSMKDVKDQEKLDDIVPGFSLHIDKVSEENAKNIVLRLKPNTQDSTKVMGRRRRRR